MPPSGSFEVTTHGGRKGTGIDAVEWAHRAAELGAGEILLNSMDADGTKDGYDTEMIAAVRRLVTVPVIASGGAGALDHFPPAIAAGADAVLAASVFHFGDLRISRGQGNPAGRGAPGAVEPDGVGRPPGPSTRPRGRHPLHPGAGPLGHPVTGAATRAPVTGPALPYQRRRPRHRHPDRTRLPGAAPGRTSR